MKNNVNEVGKRQKLTFDSIVIRWCVVLFTLRFDVFFCTIRIKHSVKYEAEIRQFQQKIWKYQFIWNELNWRLKMMRCIFHLIFIRFSSQFRIKQTIKQMYFQLIFMSFHEVNSAYSSLKCKYIVKLISFVSLHISQRKYNLFLFKFELDQIEIFNHRLLVQNDNEVLLFTFQLS